jgi:hypothetical protein
VPGTRRLTTVALVALACAGCGAGTGADQALPDGPGGTPGTVPAAGSATASAPASRGAAPTVDHADVMAVYRGWWRALEAAYARGDADAPALADYAVDPILSSQRASIARLQAQGIVQRTRFTLAPRLRYRTRANAEVEDCVRGPANTYHDAATGRLRPPRGYRNDAPTEDRLLTTLQRRGDQWYVVAATARGQVTC